MRRAGLALRASATIAVMAAVAGAPAVLHAIFPATGKRMHFVSALPADIARLGDALALHGGEPTH